MQFIGNLLTKSMVLGMTRLAGSLLYESEVDIYIGLDESDFIQAGLYLVYPKPVWKRVRHIPSTRVLWKLHIPFCCPYIVCQETIQEKRSYSGTVMVVMTQDDYNHVKLNPYRWVNIFHICDSFYFFLLCSSLLFYSLFFCTIVS